MKLLNLHSDNHSIPTWLRPITDAGHEIYMSTNVEYNIAIPENAKIVIFNASDIFTVKETAGISFAPLGSWLAQNSELSPTGLILEGITTLYFKAQQATYLKLSFYR